PRKRPVTRNTAGLQNQNQNRSGLKRSAPHSSSELESPSNKPSKHPKNEPCTSSEDCPGVVNSDDKWELTTVLDSIKFIAEHDESAEESGTDLEESSIDLPFVSDDRAAAIHARTHLIDLAIQFEDNPSDETWLPPRQ
ncbi:hypothetical protein EV363DRAFT_1109465, partial [Boletus edulis]